MTIQSMTGFARTAGDHGGWRYVWEIKSVNAKGLDLRIRLAAPVEGLSEDIRRRVSAQIRRGTVFATLSLARETSTQAVRVNEALLADLVALAARFAGRDGLRPPSLDGLLAVRGVVEIAETVDSETARTALEQALLTAFDAALGQLVANRQAEGAALADLLTRRLAEIADLTERANTAPQRTADAIRSRIAAQIAQLVGSSPALDPARLHQEAVLIATRADIREELDRLVAHVAACRTLLAQETAVGRKLDFLSQELARESNTLCAKSNDVALTAIGLDLKSVVEQFREQVQNVE